MTTISLSIESLLNCILIVAGIAAIVVLTIVLAKFIKTAGELGNILAKLDTAMDDVQKMLNNLGEITETAKDATLAVKGTVRKASDSLSDISDIVSTNKSKISAVTSLVNAGTSLASLVGADKAKEAERERERERERELEKEREREKSKGKLKGRRRK